MEQINVGGLSIAYQRAGEGPPLLLLHGGLSDSREWRRQLEGLSDGFTVVAWDAPGCGRSSDPPASFRMPHYAHALAAFAEALGLGRPHVVGLSWGSTLALELYRRYPALPGTLVLASAYAGWAGSLPAEIVAERLEAVLRDLALPPEGWLPGFISTVFTERAPAEMIDEAVAIASDLHPAGARAMLNSIAEVDLREILPRIDVPTLLLFGEEDTRSPLHVAEELHAGIRGSELVLIPRAGHQCNVEAADRFNAEVRRFLRSR